MRVAIAGAAALTAEGHVMNLGDEAIAETLGTAVSRHACVSHVVAALNVRLAGGTPPPGRFSPRPLVALEREVARADAVLIGGGTMLQEDVPPRHRAGRTRAAPLSAGGEPCVYRPPHALCLRTRRRRDARSAGCTAGRQVPGSARGVRERAGWPSARLLRDLTSPKRLVVGADAVFLAAWPPAPSSLGSG